MTKWLPSARLLTISEAGLLPSVPSKSNYVLEGQISRPFSQRLHFWSGLLPRLEASSILSYLKIKTLKPIFLLLSFPEIPCRFQVILVLPPLAPDLGPTNLYTVFGFQFESQFHSETPSQGPTPPEQGEGLLLLCHLPVPDTLPETYKGVTDLRWTKKAQRAAFSVLQVCTGQYYVQDHASLQEIPIVPSTRLPYTIRHKTSSGNSITLVYIIFSILQITKRVCINK